MTAVYTGGPSGSAVEARHEGKVLLSAFERRLEETLHWKRETGARVTKGQYRRGSDILAHVEVAVSIMYAYRFIKEYPTFRKGLRALFLDIAAIVRRVASQFADETSRELESIETTQIPPRRVKKAIEGRHPGTCKKRSPTSRKKKSKGSGKDAQ